MSKIDISLSSRPAQRRSRTTITVIIMKIIYRTWVSAEEPCHRSAAFNALFIVAIGDVTATSICVHNHDRGTVINLGLGFQCICIFFLACVLQDAFQSIQMRFKYFVL